MINNDEVVDGKIYTQEEVEKIKKTSILNTVLWTLVTCLLVFLLFLTYCYGLLKDLPNDSNVFKFLSIINLYEENYVEDIDLENMIDYAIQGLIVGAEDKYGGYIPKSDSGITGSRIKTGNYNGMGITYNTDNLDNGYIEIIEIVEDSPAGRSSLQVGDKVVKINNNPVTKEVLDSLLLDINLSTIKEVDLGIESGNVIHLVLGPVKPKKVDYFVSDDVGFIKVNTFVIDTVTDFNKAIDFVVENDVKEVIFDLRGNGGGDAEAVVEMLDYILGDTLIVDLRYTSGESEKIYSDEYSKLSDNVKITIIVDKNTASASELFTMVLQDVRNAKVIGETTFGKSTILTFYTFKDGSMLSISTGHYYPISDRYIEGIGIEPDIKLSEEELDLTMYELKENSII